MPDKADQAQIYIERAQSMAVKCCLVENFSAKIDIIRNKRKIPEGVCIECGDKIEPEILSINGKAPNCQKCNLAALQKRR